MYKLYITVFHYTRICLLYYFIILDSALINTAMSRARYSVAVVGDPVVLCTFGSCRTIWQKYVKACETLGSISPDTYNMRRIKMEMQSLAESDSGRKLLGLLSQYRTLQLQLQQAANASSVARGLYGPIGAGREAQHAAAVSPPPSKSQQQMSAPSPYCLLVRPAPQTSVVNSTAVAAASAAVQLQQPQLQLYQPGVPMIYNTPQTTALYTNAVAASSAAFQLQQFQQLQRQISGMSMMPRYPGVTSMQYRLPVSPQPLLGIAPQHLYNFQGTFAPFFTPQLSQPQWR